MTKKGLGRGLDSLLGPENDLLGTEQEKEFIRIPVAFVEPNREQPRRNFDEAELLALAESVKNYGVLQPITVKSEDNGFYSIIAGERRWRAAKLAGLKEIPARIVHFSEQEELEVALVENLQRADLNPIEEALGYQKLMEDHRLTQEEVSGKVGKSRSAVANALRLLTLSEPIKTLLKEGAITSGHAKALLLVKDEAKRDFLAKKIVEDDLSVRMAEAAAQALNTKKTTGQNVPRARKTPEVLDLERILSEHMGTRVLLIEQKKGGKIEIDYYDAEQRELLLEHLKAFKK